MNFTFLLSDDICSSKGPFYYCINRTYPLGKTEHLVSLGLYEGIQIALTSVVFLWAVTGNIFITVVIYVNKHLRSPMNMYLVNLAASDLLTTLLCLWQNTVVTVFPYYPLGRTMCKIGPFTQVLCLLSSVFTLAAVALDRVYAVIEPLQSRLSPPKPTGVLLVIWTISVAFALPLCFMDDLVTYQWLDYIEEQCTHIASGDGLRIYKIVASVLLFFLPVSVMVVAYVLIVFKLWVTQTPGESGQVASRLHYKARIKVVKLACVVLGVFIICWSPLMFLILFSLEYDEGPLPEWFGVAIFWSNFLAYMNSAINPVLYGGFNKSYRQAIRNLFKYRTLRTGVSRTSSMTPRSSCNINANTQVSRVASSKALVSVRPVRTRILYRGTNSTSDCHVEMKDLISYKKSYLGNSTRV